MPFPTRLLFFVVTALGVSVTAAEALKFEVLPTSDNRGVLLIRDCGGLLEDYQFGSDGKVLFDSDGNPLTKCQPWEDDFKGPGEYKAPGARTPVRYDGDAATLRSYLQENAKLGFFEVWLVSNGGNLQAGVEMGRLLRAYRVTVRVPDQARLERATGRKAVLGPGKPVSCVSSCTVAFMGGMFRYKDDGASYQVHSASTVGEGIRDEDRESLANGDLEGIATSKFLSARRSARQLLTLFQNTLLLYTRLPQRAEDDEAFWQEARDLRGVNLPYTPARKEQDLQRLRSEGVEAAGQDIMMRIERDSMQAAIEELRLRLPSLGPRAEPALKMLEAMYDVGILATQSLSTQTMLSMGYLTRDASTEP